MKGGKKIRFNAWLRFKAAEDIPAAQQLAVWFKDNQDKPVPGTFSSVCSLVRTHRRGAGEAEGWVMGAYTLPRCRQGSW